MSDVKTILLCAVGGQGAILTSNILTDGLLKAGFDVKMSEVHGMAQRGGSVTTQIRYGKKVHSALLGNGQADIGVAFERMEAVRYTSLMKPGARFIVNDFRLTPMSVAVGAAEYPENAIAAVSAVFDTVVVPAADIATEVGNVRTMNLVLLGALLKELGLADNPDVDWEEVIASAVPEKLRDVNIKAFRAGVGF
ncbi:MAG: indolepyruvate oxidoreductase subunit beta [Clostridiales bacterium]|nr:indolepyruvate oxidoreductase subunit beta [Clostridiales bacterium]